MAHVTTTTGVTETAVLSGGVLCPFCLGGFARLARATILRSDPELASLRFALLPPGAEA